jgi:hypothetical protein
MTDTQALMGKIAALRQRLEQAQGLANEAGKVITALGADDGGRLEILQRRAANGAEHDVLLDASLRQLAGDDTAPRVLPTQLTARARRVLERGREHLGRLRTIADQVEGNLAADGSDEPLDRLYRETAAMADSILRMVQAFPDSPSAQLRLCEGLEAILHVVAQRVALLTGALATRRGESERVETLAALLNGISSGSVRDVRPLVALAESLVAEANDGRPLRFVVTPAADVPRFVAGHALTVAGVAARLLRHDPELRSRSAEVTLAALVLDVGMLQVPAKLLTHAGPLDDAGRRAIEAHTRVGADMLRNQLPDSAWLAEAALAHHERGDGTGYPNGLREIQVSSLTRLLAVCDVYAALCSPRPHRAAFETRTALTDTLLMAEAGALDRQHAERLLALSFYPVGTAVELADGSVGVVVATHPGRVDLSLPARPVIALLVDGQGRPLATPIHFDLAESESRSIVRSLPSPERRELLGGQFPEWA